MNYTQVIKNIEEKRKYLKEKEEQYFSNTDIVKTIKCFHKKVLKKSYILTEIINVDNALIKNNFTNLHFSSKNYVIRDTSIHFMGFSNCVDYYCAAGDVFINYFNLSYCPSRNLYHKDYLEDFVNFYSELDSFINDFNKYLISLGFEDK